MYEKQYHEAFHWNEKVAVAAGSILVSGMLACLGASLQEFGSRLFPGWNGAFLPWLCLVIAIEAIFSEGRVRHLSIVSASRIAYRVSELILLTLALKIFLIALRGDDFVRVLSSLRVDFPISFLAGEFGGVWMVMVGVWGITGSFAGQLFELVEDTDLLRPGSEPQFFTSRREIRHRLAGQIFFLGAVMVVLTVMARVDLKLIWGELPPVEAGALNVLLYFFFALILLSQGQFAVLRASWIWQRIPVTRPMALGWLRYSLIFLGVLSLLVLLLPTGYSLSLITLGKVLLSFIFGILNLIFLLLLLPILLLLNLLARMRGEAEPFENPLANPFQPPPTSEDVTPLVTAPLSEVFQSLLFWSIFLLVCGYALVQYFKHNKELLERLRRIPGLRWLMEGIYNFLEWLRGATRTAVQMAAAGWERVRSQPRPGQGSAPWQMIRPNRLPPRERVMYYYLAVIHRGQGSGVPRGAAQTPREYAADLQRVIPDEPGVVTLTEAFQEARYTQHAIPEETASTAKEMWEKLRGLIRSRKKSG